MKFKSIRKKLISRVSLILVLSFSGVLSVVAYLNFTNAQINLSASEETIREGLIAKGKTLIANNSQALKGMAEDNAFTAVQELVTSTVNEDSDILYGIYMDIDLQPWASASPDNREGSVDGGEELDDEISLWANKLEAQSYKLINYRQQQVYEFAAPVIVDDEILGHIRYGLTTQKMLDSLYRAKIAGKQTLIQTMSILGGLGLTAIILGFIATRAMATRITQPLGTLTDAAGTIANGDYKSEVKVKSNDEIGLLANNFDTMRQTIRKKMRDLARINSTGEVLAVLLDQTKAFEEVLRTMKEQTNVNYGSVYLLKDNNMLELEAFFPERSEEVNPKPASFKLGEGILGKTAAQKKVIFVPDTAQDPNYTGSFHSEPRTLLCVPLLDHEELLGVMNFSGELNSVIFEDSDIEFANSIARLLVITVKNIRMREVIEEQNRTLEQKVKERTAALQEKTNDILNMMQNMHQGLFTVMNDGAIHQEYAAYLEEIFETKDIAHQNFMTLLFSNTDLGSNVVNQVETAVDAIIDECDMMFECNSHLLISEYTKIFPDGRKKIIELDWDPIVFEDTVDKLMVTVRDVTDLKALQAEAEQQKRELEIIGHILSIDEAKFNGFLSNAYEFIDICRNIITTTDSKNTEVLSTLFRNIHTIKGNARTYNFSYITDSVHDVENTYDELRKHEDKEWDQEQLLAELAIAEADIKRYEVISTEKLGRGAASRSTDIDTNTFGIDLGAIQSLLTAQQKLDISILPPDVQAHLKQTFKTLAVIEAQPLEQILSDVLSSVESLAKELEKEPPIINITDNGHFIKNSAEAMLNNIFMHIFRNAIDHGIESPAERKAQAKSPQGHIDLKAEELDGKLMLTIKDDGKGLPLKKLKAKAIECNTQAETLSDEDVAQLIFASGFSTAEKVTEVSGRGVGMDAVKQFLQQNGGSIKVILGKANTEGEFRSFETQILLPSSMYLSVPS
tara:strand:- start:20317 stop:23205 length:2889 start_codon:yes stop_codon:yes gene_type:complete